MNMYSTLMSVQTGTIWSPEYICSMYSILMSLQFGVLPGVQSKYVRDTNQRSGWNYLEPRVQFYLEFRVHVYSRLFSVG